MHICCVYVLGSKQTYMDYNIKNLYKISTVTMPLGISYISSSLQKAGHTTEMIYCNEYTYKKGITNYIEKEPQIFAISIVSAQDLPLTEILVKELREKYKKEVKIIVGGTQVTADPEQIVRDLNIDALCIGAGEKAVPEYLKQVEQGKYQKTDNLWIKVENEWIKCDKAFSIENLDELPYPDRKCWEKWLYTSNITKTNWEKWLYDSGSYQAVLLNRGCIYNCIFCANSVLRQKSSNRYFNVRSNQSILEEIDYLVKNNKNLKGIKLEGDNALVDINKFKNLCVALKEYNSKLKQKLEFLVTINFTPNLLEKDNDVIDLMAEANFTFVRFSLESGSFEMRKKLGKPDYNNDQFISFCDKLHQRKINIMVYVMYCFPFETKETYWQTVNCLRQCRPEHFNYTWLRLYNKISSIERPITFMDFWYYFSFKFMVYIKYTSLFRTIALTMSIRKIIDKIEEVKEFFHLRHFKNKKYEMLAKEEFGKCNFKQAIKYFNQVRPTEYNHWIYADRAIAKMKIGDYKGAIKDFDKVLELDPQEVYKQKRQECLDCLK